MRIGSRNEKYTSFLPGKLRRASTYDAGTPITTEISTTSSDTCSVTITTSSRPKLRHASAYQFVVNPSGSQVPNQRVPNELTSTDPTTPARLIRKNATAPQTSHAPGLATIRRLPGSRATISPCPPS